MNLELEEALAYFNQFTLIFSLSLLPMGFLTDVFFGHRRSLILSGAAIAFGCLLAILLDFEWLRYSLGLIAVGMGWMHSNLVVGIGNHYTQSGGNRRLGFLFYILAVNLGSFLGALGTTWVYDSYGFEWSYLVMMVIILQGTALYAFFSHSKQQSTSDETILTERALEMANLQILDAPEGPQGQQEERPAPDRTDWQFQLSLVIFASLMFITSQGLYDFSLTNRLRDFSSLELLGRASYFTAYLYVPITILLGLYLYYRPKANSLRLFGSNFLFLAIGSSLLLLILTWVNGRSSGILWLIFLPAIFTNTAENIYSVLAPSLLTRLAPVAWAATIVGFFSAALRLCRFVVNWVTTRVPGATSLLLIVIVLGILMALVLSLYQRSEQIEASQQN